MAFTKKKQFKFEVNLKVEELVSVPLVNAVVFCKIRFVGGGSRLIGLTPGEELNDHRVIWNQYFQFPCKMTANSITMELEPVFCRISIRREMKGGKTHQKIGFVDLNLAEYAGSGSISRRYLLEGYSSTSRLDNSLLKLSISLTLVCGDLCFKVPKSHSSSNHEAQYSLRRPPSVHQMSETGVRTILITSSNHGIQRSTQNLRDVHDQQSSNCDGSRPPKSCDSSSFSSSSTLLQSRSNSENAINKKCVNRNSANFSSSSMPRNSGKERRTDVSRVDADKLVDDIIRSTDLNLDSCGEAGGLQLIVRKDGTTLLGSIPGGDPGNALITINS